jgi:hypothetical protein
MGRPSLKTPELVASICARLAQGEPLAQICRDDGMPDPSTVWDWQQTDKAVAQAIARARELGFDAIAADSLSIVDTEPDRVLTDVGDRADPAHVSWLKNRAEHRLKLLAKWDPKRYGDKIDVTSGGEALGIADTILRRRAAAKVGE